MRDPFFFGRDLLLFFLNIAPWVLLFIDITMLCFCLFSCWVMALLHLCCCFAACLHPALNLPSFFLHCYRYRISHSYRRPHPYHVNHKGTSIHIRNTHIKPRNLYLSLYSKQIIYLCIYIYMHSLHIYHQANFANPNCGWPP